MSSILDQAKNTIGSGLQRAGEGLHHGIDAASGKLGVSPKTLTALLASAAGTGLLGGAASAGIRDKNETPWQRRRRIIRDALLSAGAGAGAVGAGMAGWRAFNTALPAKDVDPVQHALTGPLSRGIAGAGGVAFMHRGMKANEIASREGLFQSLTGHGGLGLDKYNPALSGPGAGGHTSSETIDKEMRRILSDKAPGGARESLFKVLEGNSGSPTAASQELMRAGLLPGNKGVAAETAQLWKQRLFGGVPSAASKELLPPWAKTVVGGSAMFAPELLGGVRHLWQHGTETANDKAFREAQKAQ